MDLNLQIYVHEKVANCDSIFLVSLLSENVQILEDYVVENSPILKTRGNFVYFNITSISKIRVQVSRLRLP